MNAIEGPPAKPGSSRRGATEVAARLTVLLVDEQTERAAHLERELLAIGVYTVHQASNTLNLLDRVLAVKPDLVFVEVDSPKRDTLEQLTSVTHRLPVVLAAADRSPQAIAAAVRAGVSSYVTVGTRTEELRPLLDLAFATFDRFKRLEKSVARSQRRPRERARVDEAKALLMERRGLTEPEAYASLRKLAMDTNRPIAAVSNDLAAYLRTLGA